ncbi:PspC domain-containing protein [Corynebacterium lubricantis]|uniref:PspC domain-containing protein n=1 Tax=Corynebacterium lubricantis TaxID=541095 RepID=UPI0003760268|nr:PspC domain-containing protein [Corynebacterium lubricantis]
MSTFNDTLKDIWATRPPRIPKKQGGNAYLGGVCEGLGARYRIDPTLIRIIFVVTFFAWGGSLLVYLLLMLVMPRYGMTTSPWDAVAAEKDTLNPTEKEERNTGWVLIVFSSIMTIGLLGGMGASSTSLSGLLTLVVFGALIYFLHQRTPEAPDGLLANPPQGTSKGMSAPETSASEGASAQGETTSSQSFSPDFSTLHPVDGYPHPDVGRNTPPAWDPLGTVPELWDLPEPAQPQPEPPKKRKHGWAWIIGTTTVVVLIFSATGFGIVRNVDLGDTSGDRMVTMSSEADLTNIEHSIGELTVDMSNLPVLDSDRTITIDNSLGETHITPSSEARTQFECSVSLGTAHCPGLVNPDAEGGTLTVRIDNSLGDINVRN